MHAIAATAMDSCAFGAIISFAKTRIAAKVWLASLAPYNAVMID